MGAAGRESDERDEVAGSAEGATEATAGPVARPSPQREDPRLPPSPLAHPLHPREALSERAARGHHPGVAGDHGTLNILFMAPVHCSVI